MADFEAALDVVRPTSMAESTLEVAAVTLDDVGDLAEVKQTLTESVLWPLTYPDTFARLGVSPPRGVLLYGRPAAARPIWSRRSPGTGTGERAVGQGRRAAEQVGRRQRDGRSASCSAGPARPRRRWSSWTRWTRWRRPRPGHRRRHHRPRGGGPAHRAGRVEALRNVVVIGRDQPADLIDPALLRPGRLERTGLRAAAGRRGADRDPAGGVQIGAAGRIGGTWPHSAPNWTVTRPPTVRR
jgi:transitional endoplasmic reticulum ATPase